MIIVDKKVAGKSKAEQMNERQQELERRLQDVTGQLGSGKKNAKKGENSLKSSFVISRNLNHIHLNSSQMSPINHIHKLPIVSHHQVVLVILHRQVLRIAVLATVQTAKQVRRFIIIQVSELKKNIWDEYQKKRIREISLQKFNSCIHIKLHTLHVSPASPSRFEHGNIFFSSFFLLFLSLRYTTTKSLV